ncbi:unnamed protein product [Penicillium salamii]|uniref:DUF8032 domain-containing protein n=1 Tax=Penicillium salamii TaxID=1612424 RepID=A0A9W4K1X0_9EURO|nr:unnamed protein product [Penicillium salamii]CAG8336686.1 unnamed protein product [Penicillium salamii]CAG8338110.1 unnamed protein product [Penicillium salamii]CAG8387512.1 unnamed protein product [Penicillium salamii]CAG8395793.1 unnamed protein product [Penicillium salamii]
MLFFLAPCVGHLGSIRVICCAFQAIPARGFNRWSNPTLHESAHIPMLTLDRCNTLMSLRIHLAVFASLIFPLFAHLRNTNSGRPGSQSSQNLQRTTQGQEQGSASPVQPASSYPPTTYPPSQPLGNGALHRNLYGPPQEAPFYTTHPSYTNPASAHYPSSGPPDLMASTAQMQRPYPPMYHTPQSSSPASVASQPQDQHGRPLYGHSPQVPPQMFNYHPYSPMNPVQPSPYAAHHSPQQHPLTTQSMMMPPHKAPVQMPPHQSAHIPTTAMSASPIMKLDTSQHPLPQQQMLNPPSATSNHGMSANNPLASPTQGSSSNAAPGPIPATTPLVVRQDASGVQWIAFEYSRDRVKMEYTIRCDVESVVVDTLSQDFKTENCVYPRACCSKDQYRGNRLVYETECNAVGWALADLNPALRGKRGLIQRAVDSWRNSNQDPRLRSRRVRRQAKMTRRQSVPAQVHMPPGVSLPEPGPGPGHGSALGGMPMPGPAPRPNLGPLSMGPPQMHHHHQPDGLPNEEISGTEYSGRSDRLPQTDLRPAHIFHEAPTSLTSSNGPSMPPLRDTSLSSLTRHPTIATAMDHDMDTQGPTNDDLFSQLPEGKRRKFILVDDTQHKCRVRVKVVLDKVNMDEIPDRYRESTAVYPRTYFPIQMPDENRVVPAKRFFRDDTESGEVDTATTGRTTVPAPSLDPDLHTGIAVPKLSRKRHHKELLLNDLGYRMSWSQSRVFSGRMLFLQRSLDAYRNKMRSSMLAAGKDAASIPDHFDTRRGKRRFLERGRRGSETVAQRTAEEVEC